MMNSHLKHVIRVLIAGVLSVHAQTKEVFHSRLQEVLNRDQTISAQLQTLQQNIERLEHDFDVLEDQKSKNVGHIEEKQAMIEGLEVQLQSKSQELQVLLRKMYQEKDEPKAELFLQSPLEKNREQDLYYMKKWIAVNESMMASYKSEANHLKDEKTQLEALIRTQSELEQKLQSRKTLLELEKKDLDSLRTLIQGQKDYYARLMKEIEQSSLKMDDFVRQWQSTQTPESSRFTQMRGKLIFPVKGVIEKKYGPYHDATVNAVVYHKGIDVRSSKLSPVRVVFDGKIVFANWFEGYGKTVIVDHEAGYFSLYSHLDSYDKKVGDQVIIGDIIGKVGDTGSLKGSYLYFELRKKGISEDPLPWLGKK